MTFRTLALTAVVSLSFSIAPLTFAHDHDDHDAAPIGPSMASLHGELVPAKKAPADWVAKAQAEYPLESCVVSEDSLKEDSSGPIDFVYKQEGKPDRLVRFCCKDCVKDFKKDPTKYIGEIDAAAAKKHASAEPATHS